MTFQDFLFIKAESIELVKLVDLYNEWSSIYLNKEDHNAKKSNEQKETKANKKISDKGQSDFILTFVTK